MYENDEFLDNLIALSKSESEQYSLKIDQSIYDPKNNVWLKNKQYKNNKPTLQEAHEEFLDNFHIKRLIEIKYMNFHIQV